MTRRYTTLLATTALTLGFAGGWAAHARRPAPPPPPDPAVGRLQNELTGLKAVYELQKQNNLDIRGRMSRPQPVRQDTRPTAHFTHRFDHRANRLDGPPHPVPAGRESPFRLNTERYN
jgi:hypothetical protein